MAKKYYTYKKYEENSKKADRFLRAVHRKSVSDWKKASRRREAARNKRMRAYKREQNKRNFSKQKALTNTNISTPREPLTFGDIIFGLFVLFLFVLFFVLWIKFGFWESAWATIILFTLLSQITDDISNKSFDLWDYLFIGLFIITVILCFKIGFWKGILISVGICILIIVLSTFSQTEETNNETTPEDHTEDRRAQLPYLHSLLAEIKKHQDIANSSNDPDEVKRHLDCLIGIIDEILTFDEGLLKEVGMAKANAELAKSDILKVYDIMIADARDSNSSESLTS